MRMLRFLLLLLVLVLGAGAAHAAGRTRLDASYAMYTGGFDVVEIEGHYDFGTHYNFNLTAFTRGILGKLAPWKGILETSGARGKSGVYMPSTHSFLNRWRSKVEVTSFSYDRQGRFVAMQRTDEDGRLQTPEVEPELTKGTVDMLSALGIVLDGFEKTGRCTASVPVFDGRRRFNMKFTDAGATVIKPGRYSIFSGDARMCTVEIVPVAGKWHEKPRGWMSIQEQSRAENKLPRLWIGRPAPDAPAIPVRFEVYTRYGTILMHLTGLK